MTMIMIMMMIMMMMPHHEVAGAGVEVRVVVPLLPGPHAGRQQLPGSLTEIRSAPDSYRQTTHRWETLENISSAVHQI